MTANRVFPKGRTFCAALLVGTVLGGIALPASAQQTAGTASAQPADAQPPATAVTAPAPQRQITSVSVSGNQRLEPETILSYTSLRPGEPYDNERLDQALRDLLATELFADVQIAGRRTHRHEGVDLLERGLPGISLRDLGADAPSHQLHRRTHR